MSREGSGNPLQYSCLENPMNGGAWWAAVHGVAKSQMWLSDFTFTFHFHALEKEMATHSSVLAWRIPGTGETGGLPSMGSHRVGHDWSDLAAAAATDGITIYIENPKQQKNFLKLRSQCSRIIGSSVNIEKSIKFLYTSNKQVENEIKTVLYSLIPSKMKCLAINVSKYVKIKCEENSRTLMNAKKN